MLRDQWQPARKLVALQKGAQQGGEFSCTLLRREDLQGRDWDDEVVSGGGQGGDTQEVRYVLCESAHIESVQCLVKDFGSTTCFTSGWGTHSGGVKRYQQPIVQICLKEYFENLKINLFLQTRKERVFSIIKVHTRCLLSPQFLTNVCLFLSFDLTCVCIVTLLLG